MTITKHAKERLTERFKIKADSEIYKLKNKFERDFISCDTQGKQEIKVVIWKEQYLEGVIIDNKLVTVINKGYTQFHHIKQRSKRQRYRNKNRRNARTCRAR